VHTRGADPQEDRRVGSPALVGAGITAAILYVVAAGALGTRPAAADTGAQVVAWFREHRDGVRWSVWALTVGTPIASVMFALLRRLLPAPATCSSSGRSPSW